MSTAFRSVSHARRPSSVRRAPLYPVPAQQSSVYSVSQGSKTSLKAIRTPAFGAKAVRQLPAPRSLPLWLRLLIQAQRSSLVIAFLLVTATLLVYGSTVYTQQLWSKEYRKLKTLQRNEREMIATSASLENQLALQAERPGSGLVPQTSDSTIFLEPASQRPTLMASPRVPNVEASPNTPLGY